MNHATRLALYQQIEADRGSRVIAMVTGERLGLQTQIAADALPPFIALLDQIGPTQKLSLLLDTNGGHTSAAWRIIKLVRSFCDELEVLIPSKAMSAGTLMSLAANKIVMTKQAALGPIDPSLPDHPLAPDFTLPNGQVVKVPVSAESVRGYIDEVKKDITDPVALASVWNNLSSYIHPLILGDLFRLGAQIRLMAGELIKDQVSEVEKQDTIIQLLCSDSGSHDFTIDRRKARELGLNIEKPTAALYALLNQLVQSYHAQLMTTTPYSLPALLPAGSTSAPYQLVRGLVESTDASYGYATEGAVTRMMPPVPPPMPNMPPMPGNVIDQRSFDGWKKL